MVLAYKVRQSLACAQLLRHRFAGNVQRAPLPVCSSPQSFGFDGSRDEGEALARGLLSKIGMSDLHTTLPVPQPDRFSLVLGGPLFQLLRRAHLADDALQLLRKRVVVISLLAWLPLLLFSLLQGDVRSGTLAVPFLKDAELHVRFLFAMPLLIVAELAVHGRMQPVLRLFRERGVVPAAMQARLHGAADSAVRLRNSLPAELLLVAVVYVLGIQIVWRHFIALDAATWYATPSPDGTALSPAGLWYGYVSLPMFQFLLCRWYFRIFVWGRFLWQVSRIKLSLIPTHPDRLGGLGFLSGIAYAFMPLAAAHGAILVQSLADMSNGHDVVRGMASVPVTKEAVLRVALATVAPVIPLALTMMPLEELLKRLFGMLF
jgi:hypothetical protein